MPMSDVGCLAGRRSADDDDMPCFMNISALVRGLQRALRMSRVNRGCEWSKVGAWKGPQECQDSVRQVTAVARGTHCAFHRRADNKTWGHGGRLSVDGLLLASLKKEATHLDQYSLLAATSSCCSPSPCPSHYILALPSQITVVMQLPRLREWEVPPWILSHVSVEAVVMWTLVQHGLGFGRRTIVNATIDACLPKQ